MQSPADWSTRAVRSSLICIILSPTGVESQSFLAGNLTSRRCTMPRAPEPVVHCHHGRAADQAPQEVETACGRGRHPGGRRINRARGHGIDRWMETGAAAQPNEAAGARMSRATVAAIRRRWFAEFMSHPK